jgi:hypothetical protein
MSGSEEYVMGAERSYVILDVILSNMKYNVSSFAYLGLHKRHVGQ